MGDNELDDATRGMRDNLWTDSLWQTYQESIDIIVPDPDSPDGPGSRITRKLSIGMSVKSDNRAPAKVLQYALSKALNSIMEEEKERWLDTHTMKEEISAIRRRKPEDGGEDKGAEPDQGGANGGPPDSGVPSDTKADAEGPDADGCEF